MAQQFRTVVRSVVQDYGDVLFGIQDITPGRQYVPFRGDQEAALVRFQALQTARTVDLHDFGLHGLHDVGERSLLAQG